MTTKKKITILIPAYNEESVVKPLYQRLKEISQELRKYSFEFLFINDGSKDSTLKIIKTLSNEDNRISYISLSRNYGKEIAMIAGLDYAKSNDATIIIDADLQDPPELIPDMIKYWEDGYDDVYAQRRSREGESFIKKKTSEWFYKLLQKSTRINIQKDTGDFRLLSKRSVESLTMLRESQRYTKGMFSWIGYKKKKIVYDRSPRLSGKSKWNYWQLFNLAIEGLTSFTTAPLRLAMITGVMVSFLAFVYLFIIIIRTTTEGSVPGYPSLMATVLFLGGVQLLALGIIGEYIGRIFNETKQRPLYLIDEYHTNDKQK